METLNVFITRIAIAALTSALFCAAAVFFVVDISLRGVETAIIATNDRFDDVNARLDTLERSVERSTDLFREEMRAGFATVGKDMRGETSIRNLEQDEWIQATASALAQLSLLVSENKTNVSEASLEQFTELRIQVTIICRDILGPDHPACLKFP